MAPDEGDYCLTLTPESHCCSEAGLLAPSNARFLPVRNSGISGFSGSGSGLIRMKLQLRVQHRSFTDFPFHSQVIAKPEGQREALSVHVNVKLSARIAQSRPSDRPGYELAAKRVSG